MRNSGNAGSNGSGFSENGAWSSGPYTDTYGNDMGQQYSQPGNMAEGYGAGSPAQGYPGYNGSARLTRRARSYDQAAAYDQGQYGQTQYGQGQSYQAPSAAQDYYAGQSASQYASQYGTQVNTNYSQNTTYTQPQTGYQQSAYQPSGYDQAAGYQSQTSYGYGADQSDMTQPQTGYAGQNAPYAAYSSQMQNGYMSASMSQNNDTAGSAAANSLYGNKPSSAQRSKYSLFDEKPAAKAAPSKASSPATAPAYESSAKSSPALSTATTTAKAPSTSNSTSSAKASRRTSSAGHSIESSVPWFIRTTGAASPSAKSAAPSTDSADSDTAADTADSFMSDAADYEESYVASYRKKAKKSKQNRIRLIAAVALVAVLAVTLIIAFAAGVFDKRYKVTLADGSVVKMTQKELVADLTNDVMPEGIHINGIDVSGMTKEEALASIKANQPERPLEIDVSLVLNGKAIPLDLSSLPIEVNDVEVVDKAFNYMRPSGDETPEELIAMHDAREAIKSTPAEYQTAYTPNTDDLSAQVHAVLDPFDHEAVDAVITGFDLQSCQFEYTPSEQGYEIDIDKALNDVKDMLDGGVYAGEVEVAAEVLTPYLTSTMIEEDFGLISSTSSSTSSSNSNRRNNIATAASSINGTILQNGESFSFNGTVGERTAANGYMEAGVIVDGATEQGYGGGVCQVSTMVYESAVKADLQINERHPHQWPARYADDGCDAAVDWGSQDLTFTNTSGYPIVISAYHDSSSSTISVAIYGHKLPDGEYIRFTGSSEITTEYQTTYVQNTELPVGERNTTREGHNGLTAHSYKIRYDAGGNEIDRTEYTTYYNVINAEEEVGTLQPDGTQATFDSTTGEVTTTETTTTTVDEYEEEDDDEGYIIYEDDDEIVYYTPGDDEDEEWLY